jgi:hypothetical protein
MAKRFILDIGSNVSIMQPGISTGDVRVTSVKPCGDWENPRHERTAVCYFYVERGEYKHSFLVCQLPTDAAGLLGTDFFRKQVPI